VVELAPGIWQFVGQQRCAHVYLLRGTRRTALIDTGLPTTAEHLSACLAQAGMRAEDIDLVVLTHEHVDHSGGAARFAGRTLVAAHPQAANKLRTADEFALMSRAFSEHAVPFEIDLTLVEGSAIDLGGIELTVLHTPGHCSGSICLYEPARRWLFSADTIMARGIVGGVLHSGNTSDYISSLERLQHLRIDRLLPGHGHLSDDAQADIALGIARLEGLIDDSHALFSALYDTEDGFDEVMRSLRDLNVM
jgi:glyoxylase-like metal-dependent hydrolase (beta-lactamase superfamily II)